MAKPPPPPHRGRAVRALGGSLDFHYDFYNNAWMVRRHPLRRLARLADPAPVIRLKSTLTYLYRKLVGITRHVTRARHFRSIGQRGFRENPRKRRRSTRARKRRVNISECAKRSRAPRRTFAIVSGANASSCSEANLRTKKAFNSFRKSREAA